MKGCKNSIFSREASHHHRSPSNIHTVAVECACVTCAYRMLIFFQSPKARKRPVTLHIALWRVVRVKSDVETMFNFEDDVWHNQAIFA